MTTFREHLQEKLLNSEFQEAWEESEGEYQAMKALVSARGNAGITQKELSETTGIPQKTISKIETGNTNTTVNTLAKIAKGLGKDLRIEFV